MTITASFESGYITLPMARLAQPIEQRQYGDRVAQGGMQQTLNTRQVKDDNIVQDQSLNFKFSPTPHWDINLDAQYVKAQARQARLRRSTARTSPTRKSTSPAIIRSSFRTSRLR